MVLLATYDVYRKASRELIDKVMKASLSRDALDRSGKLLGITRGGVFVFDSEEEMTLLFDFAIHDCRVRGKNAVEHYAATVAPASDIEREILEGFRSARTSLFKVVSVSRSDNLLVLRDLLNVANDVQLTDVNLSKTVGPGLLLFLRVVPLRDFSMTSGFMFAFEGHQEGRLLAAHKRPAGKGESLTVAQKRFIDFLKAHRARGIKVQYK